MHDLRVLDLSETNVGDDGLAQLLALDNLEDLNLWYTLVTDSGLPHVAHMNNLRRLKLDSLRESVSIALQENLLFGETVAENIRFAVPDASREAIEAAARVACADDFIRDLPDGYDTLLGDRKIRRRSLLERPRPGHRGPPVHGLFPERPR